MFGLTKKYQIEIASLKKKIEDMAIYHKNRVDTLNDDKRRLQATIDELDHLATTTTVEEMIKMGGANAKKIWDKANPKVRDANGKT